MKIYGEVLCSLPGGKIRNSHRTTDLAFLTPLVRLRLDDTALT